MDAVGRKMRHVRGCFSRSRAAVPSIREARWKPERRPSASSSVWKQTPLRPWDSATARWRTLLGPACAHALSPSERQPHWSPGRLLGPCDVTFQFPQNSTPAPASTVGAERTEASVWGQVPWKSRRAGEPLRETLAPGLQGRRVWDLGVRKPPRSARERGVFMS